MTPPLGKSGGEIQAGLNMEVVYILILSKNSSTGELSTPTKLKTSFSTTLAFF